MHTRALFVIAKTKKQCNLCDCSWWTNKRCGEADTGNEWGTQTFNFRWPQMILSPCITFSFFFFCQSCFQVTFNYKPPQEIWFWWWHNHKISCDFQYAYFKRTKELSTAVADGEFTLVPFAFPLEYSDAVFSVQEETTEQGWPKLDFQ